MTTTTRRRAGSALFAVAALTTGMALQPLTAPPAEAGVNCGTPLAIGDCTAPETVLTVKPARVTSLPSAVFEMGTAVADPDDPHVVFECKLERGLPPQTVVLETWTDCSVTGEQGRSRGRVVYLDLLPGDYTFSARATDVARPVPILFPDEPNVEQEPATYSWTVVEGGPGDQPGAPQTTIVKAPKRWHRFPYAEVTFRADEPASEFVCRLNGRVLPGPQCSTRPSDPQAGYAQLMRLDARKATFTVQARDLDGNLDSSPATTTWHMPLDSTALTHSKQWKKRHGYGHYRDTYSVTNKRGATLSQGVSGMRELVLAVTQCPTCGKLKVSLGDKKVATVDLRAKKERSNRLVKVKTWRAAQRGRVTLTVVSKKKRVVVEGLGWANRR